MPTYLANIIEHIRAVTPLGVPPRMATPLTPTTPLDLRIANHVAIWPRQIPTATLPPPGHDSLYPPMLVFHDARSERQNSDDAPLTLDDDTVRRVSPLVI